MKIIQNKDFSVYRYSLLTRAAFRGFESWYSLQTRKTLNQVAFDRKSLLVPG